MQHPRHPREGISKPTHISAHSECSSLRLAPASPTKPLSKVQSRMEYHSVRKSHVLKAMKRRGGNYKACY